MEDEECDIENEDSEEEGDDVDEDNVKQNPMQDDTQEFNEITSIMGTQAAEKFAKNVVGYISGFISKKLCQKNKCVVCKTLCVQMSPDDGDEFTELLKLKQRGGLFIPSKLIIDLCWNAELTIKQILRDDKRPNIFYIENLKEEVSERVLKKFDMEQYQFDFDHDSIHLNSLVLEVIEYYVKIKMRSFAKNLNQEKEKFFLRQKLSRLLNFLHV